MGVPSFYRWLVNKYPKIVSDSAEEKGEHVDYSLPNPSGMEFDNFYLDMNGIIHPCFHPDDNLFPPTTFDEVFSSVYEYIDRLFNIVRPRKLLFMAIDGVAPRAKMNQQRARRFRAAKDIQMAEEMEEKLRKQFVKEGKALLPKEESELADSNIITPGTEFMHMLSKKLQCYISRRMSENPAWGNIKVIISDDKVPGEGEHKIMSFIRAQRASPGYDPNTRHCLYGLDADLIMLALATHEIHFSILREEVLSPKVQLSHETAPESSINRAETHSLKSREWFKEKSSCESVIESEKLVLCKEALWSVNKRQACQFLNVWVLREYLALDLEITSSEKFECDLERIIDDFIFICFFAGNDFLPHMPSLEIHEGCIDLLMHVYKKEFQNLGGYLVDMQKVEDIKSGYIKFKRVERFILTVGAYEDKIFSKRSQLRERKLRRILSEYRDAKDYEKNNLDDGRSSDIVVSYAAADVDEELKISATAIDDDRVLNNTKELKQKLKDYIKNQSDLFKDGGLGTDKVKFGTPGWRERYYKEKFSAQSPDEIQATRKNVVAKYGEGLCWVLLYYFSGVPSWTWFYPYHYGPFASDLKGLSQTKVKFQKGLPFKPFDQLMGVLPPGSAHALPIAYKGLMIDKNSNIIDFYPTEFETDIDGKRFLWQGICKLPFIEEERLLVETRKVENELKDHEKIRNLQTLDRLFVGCSSKESQQIVLHCGNRAASKQIKGAIMMDSTIEGIKGTVHLMPEDLIEADDVKNGEYARNDLCMFYEIHQGFHHVPRILEGVKCPEKTVNEEDIVETILWHENRGGSSSSNSNRYLNRRPIKPDHKMEPSSQNPAPAFISNGAGCGFSLGRGKTSSAFRLESPNHFPKHAVSKPGGELKPGTPIVAGEHMGSSSRRDYQARGGHQPSVTKYEYNGRSKAGSSRRDDYGGNEGLRISDSNQRPMSNNKPRQAGSNFWKSPGGVTYYTSEDWRLNKPSRAAPGGSWQTNYVESSGQTQHPNQSFSANTGRGRGRVWYAKKT
ncbi:hypothetical protein Pfo_007423 [Paulownia fortunei]|nr:hypothetical protein Pfo_007423 [Paulownia fortunei]